VVTRHTAVIMARQRPTGRLVPPPDTGESAAAALIRKGKLAPASNPGGVAALLAIEPVAASDDSDVAEIVSELREDRM
jgi:hypothetical protein